MRLKELPAIADQVGVACYMEYNSNNAKKEYVCGDKILQVMGSVIESGYEWFSGSSVIKLRDGKHAAPELLFAQDSASVAPYHVEVYNYGKYDSVAEVTKALEEKYGDTPWVEVPFGKEMQGQAFDARWVNPAYAAKVGKDASAEAPKRLVWKDAGTIRQGDYAGYHRVVFARACDDKSSGDRPLANPYLITRQVDGARYHDQLVSPEELRRLEEATRQVTDEKRQSVGKWTGVVNACVDAEGVVNLSERDFERGVLSTPNKAFDGPKHDASIKQAVAQSKAYWEKQKEVPTSGIANVRELPKLPDELAVENKNELNITE